MKKLLIASMLAAPVFAMSAHAAVTSKGRVLIVASSTDTLTLKGGKIDPTGFYLDELYVPAQRLIDEGYEVVFATPSGQKPAMDKTSVQVQLFHDQAELDSALKFVDSHPSLQKPLTLKQAFSQSDSFAAVYLPGGHAPMNDLMQDADLGNILNRFHEQGKPTAFLCHGPIAALAALPESKAYRAALIKGDTKALQNYGKGWIYAGYKMTIFSNAEEYVVEKDVLHGQVPFYVADALKAAGGKVSHGAEWKSYVVRDRELITGQNPQSDRELAEKLVEALSEKARK